MSALRLNLLATMLDVIWLKFPFSVLLSVCFFICGSAAVPVIMDQDSSLHSGNYQQPSGLIGRQLLKMRNAVVMAMLRIRQRVVQGFVVFFVVFLLLWISAFLYGSLYYSYMPNAAFSTSVHYYYRCVCEVLSSCTSGTQTTYCVFEPLFLCVILTQPFMFWSTEQTVTLLLLFGALIQWPTFH